MITGAVMDCSSSSSLFITLTYDLAHSDVCSLNITICYVLLVLPKILKEWTVDHSPKLQKKKCYDANKMTDPFWRSA